MVSSVLEAAWTAADFQGRLQRVGRERYHDKHSFHLKMHRGELSRDQVRCWILNRFYYQKNIPIKDAIIVSRLADREDRRRWIHRIVEHDGAGGDEGGIEAWIKLGEAAGIGRSTILDESNILPGVRFAVDAYVNFCRLKTVHEAVAASLTELFAGDLIAQRIEVIERHYPWIKPEGLDYFRRRISEAPRDARSALEFVLSNASSRQDQEKAVAALNFKCDVLWSLLDAVESACGESSRCV
jgi:pyrroloquinoline-quinone synthase